jgi:HD-like signal output (HDOD) protein
VFEAERGFVVVPSGYDGTVNRREAWGNMSNAPTTIDGQQIVTKALAKIGDIATLPEVTLRIINVVEDPKSTARDLHAIIKNDPPLSAKILKVVNSAFYGLPGQIASVDRAIVLLGLRAVKNIAIATSVTRLFQGARPVVGFDPKELWRHCMAVGVACRLIFQKKDKIHAEEAFLAGLIHDLGIIVAFQAFADRFGDLVDRVRQENMSWCQAEIEIFGVDHQMLGMGLASKWKFPMGLRAAIGYHHCPERVSDDNRVLVSAVYLANIIACIDRKGFSMEVRDDEAVVTPELLETLSLTDEDLTNLRADLDDSLASAEASLSG